MSDKPVFVAQPFLPPLQEYIPYLEEIWANKVLTNNGPMHQRLEEALRIHLGVEHISLFNNGTNALITALQALNLSGEVITTPFSFVATAHSILWNRLTPVFVDIDPDSLNIDPKLLEAAITPRTTAILAVHCYGRPCDVDAIGAIAKRNGLRVVYDAAHAFGVRCHCGSVLRHGDLSVLSFHATKVFNTFEGGAIVCRDRETKIRIDQLKNFGIVDEVTVASDGLNGKMNEVSAAFGLLQLKHLPQAISRRRQVALAYQSALNKVTGLRIAIDLVSAESNYSYFPVIVGDDFPVDRDGLYQVLKAAGIMSRRYFYPLISQFPPYAGLPSADPATLPVAMDVARRVLCLPIHSGVLDEDIERAVTAIKMLTSR
jgi:dTDP-4-amino-4,6-dideoxygalactose transaminase